MTVALLLSASLAYPGFALLCIGMHRHQRQLFGNYHVSPRARVAMQRSGWILLSASLLPAVYVSNIGIGLVVWTGTLTIAAAPLTFGLAYIPRTVALCGPGLSLLAAGYRLLY